MAQGRAGGPARHSAVARLPPGEREKGEGRKGEKGRGKAVKEEREPVLRGDNGAMPLYRWDEIALEKVTEMVSRKVVRGEREMLTQVYLKKGALVPLHAHDEEQMTYVLQGALQFLVGGEDVRVEEGEVLHIPSGVAHQAVALDDTFVLGVFSPAR